MTSKRRACILIIFGILAAFSFGGARSGFAIRGQTAAPRVEAAFERFWAARSPAEAERIVDEVLETGVSFDEAYRRLELGRDYPAQEAGVIILNNRTDGGIEHYYAVNIPPDYDPTRRYGVRFQLHGGIGRRTDNQPRGTGEIGALRGAEQIYVIPYAWQDAPWWSDDQVLILRAIVDKLKRAYNVDENQVVVSGVSDGGTGVYYVAMRETTRFASFLPLNGFIMVLANSRINDGGNFASNLRNKSMFVVNGGQDRLYPTSSVGPFVRHLMNNGVDIAYHPQPEAGHNTAWWPELKDTFENFVTDHPRDPHPDRLTWETADLLHNRAHWLVIDELGSDVGVGSSDTIDRIRGTSGPLFPETKSSGRVDLVREGNTVRATTRGVTSFRMLLSPDEFDFSQPIRVVANGGVVFEGRVEPRVETLMRWAAHDNDRTMLYAAELAIRLEP